MTSRSKRASKTINYADIANPSDDDFSDFSPPSKKKIKTKDKVNNKENKLDHERKKENTQMENPSRDTGLRKRLSLGERKFQRELEKALELSAQETILTPDSKTLNAEEAMTDKGSLVELEPSPLSPSEAVSQTLVTSVDVHSTLSGDEMGHTLSHNDNERALLETPDNDNANITFSGFPTKRHRKNVRFVQEDSDESISDLELIKRLSSDTDESDFFPSPQKKKKKKNTPVNQKTKTRPLSSSKAPPTKVKGKCPDEGESSKQSDIHPEMVNPIFTDKPSLPVPKSKSPVSSKSNSSVSSPVFSASPSISSKKTLVSTTPSRPSICSSSMDGLIGKPFKSPSSNLNSPLPNSSGSLRTGLRLGLSRKANVKPLHRITSVK